MLQALQRDGDNVLDKYYEADGGLSQAGIAAVKAGGVATNPDGCKLTVADVHWRDSSNYTKIGYKPTVKCAKKPLAVTHKNELQKHMILFWWSTEWSGTYPLKAKEVIETTTKNGFIYKDISMACKNNRASKWRGKTSSTIWATDGYIYYARQYSAHEVELACGT